MTTNVKTKIPVPAPAVPGVARGMLLFATLLWGLSFPLLRGIELAQQAVAPHVANETLACADIFVRFGTAAFLFLPIFGRGLLNVTRLELSQGIGLGLFAGTGLYLQNLGLAWTDASVSAFLTQLYTLIIPLIVAFRDRRRPTGRVFLACALVLAGAALLSPGLLTHFVLGPGEVLTLICAGFFAAQIVWVERPIYVFNRSGPVTLIMLITICLVSLVAYPFMGGTLSVTTRLFSNFGVNILMVCIIFFCTIFSFFIMNKWQRFISATEAGLIYCLEPVIATVLAAFVPGWISAVAGVNYPDEHLRWGLLVGGSLIIGAALLARQQSGEGGHEVLPID